MFIAILALSEVGKYLQAPTMFCDEHLKQIFQSSTI